MDIERKREAVRRELEEKQMQLYKLDAEYKLMLENSIQEPRKNEQLNAAHAIPGTSEDDQQHDSIHTLTI